MEIYYLCGFAFLAGFVDSIVGGGGLIQVPALFLLLPATLSASVPTVFGTNKLIAICGTGTALVQYARLVRINWKALWPAAATAFLFSFLGARTVASLNPQILRPLIVLLMSGVAAYTYAKKDFGSFHTPQLSHNGELLAGLAVGSAIGFYDGFFGPGTGSFLMFIFIGVFGFDFLTSSANTKLINVATNLSAVLYFAATDHILYRYAIPMGASNLAGALAGTRLAVLKGNRFVRIFFLLVVSAMILRMLADLFRS